MTWQIFIFIDFTTDFRDEKEASLGLWEYVCSLIMASLSTNGNVCQYDVTTWFIGCNIIVIRIRIIRITHIEAVDDINKRIIRVIIG